MSTILARSAVAALLFCGAAMPAFAHVTLETAQAAIGATYKGVLRIPHGCGTEATHTVRVEIPEGFYNAQPMPKAGWTLETVTGAYEQPYDNHGTTMTEGVREIVWSGGELPNEWYDEFVFRGTFGAGLEAGSFFFPTTQECATGEEAWLDTDGGAMPAPSVTLVAGNGADEHAHHGATAAQTSVGDITITGAFTRATLPNAPVGGGYLTIENAGGEADRLVGASSPIARETQIHEMAMDGDTMRMRYLPDGIEVPAGETVTLEPGGLHLMFMGLEGGIAEGDAVPVTLRFEKAGEVSLELVAAGSAADAPAHDHSGH